MWLKLEMRGKDQAHYFDVEWLAATEAPGHNSRSIEAVKTAVDWWPPYADERIRRRSTYHTHELQQRLFLHLQYILE